MPSTAPAQVTSVLAHPPGSDISGSSELCKGAGIRNTPLPHFAPRVPPGLEVTG